jgi:hypothetical protein
LTQHGATVALSKFDFSSLSAITYSRAVDSFRDGERECTGYQVAFGEIAKQQGRTWVRDDSLPFQYKFEGLSGVKNLIFAGGVSLP